MGKEALAHPQKNIRKIYAVIIRLYSTDNISAVQEYMSVGIVLKISLIVLHLSGLVRLADMMVGRGLGGLDLKV